VTPPPAALPGCSALPEAQHPLEASDRLAWQATTAVALLERFGDLVFVALDAAGDDDDATLQSALSERERLLAQLEPLLADLALARRQATEVHAGPASCRALATILRPVDEALRYANLLHARLTDELPGRAAASTGKATAVPTRPARRGPLALVR